MGRHLRAIVSTVTAGLLVSAAVPARVHATEYSFGIVPQFEQRKLYAIWNPIVEELERRTGLKFKLVTTLQVPAFEQEFLKGGFDFVYMNPYFVIKTATTLGYIPLVRDKVPMRGILVVPRDGPVRTVKDLDGKKVAFPTPNAPVGCLLMKVELKRQFGVTVEPLYVKTASNTYLHVAKGLAAAGGAPDKTFASQDAALKDALRVIHTTQPLPPHPVAAHPRVSGADREKVRKALLDMAAEAAGRELLAKVPMKETVSASLEEYQAMTGLGLDEFWDPDWKEE